MARIRTIKPEFPQSESMGGVSREARLCFILLWTIADDEGRLRGSPRMLASLLFPYDTDASDLIEDWLDELDREGCLVRYRIDGKTYLQICKWSDHQKIDHPTRSKIPPFREDSRIISRVRERFGEDQGGEGSRPKDQGDLGLSPLSAEPTDGLEKGADDLPKIRPEEFGNVWNRRRGPLPKIETFTESRRKKVLTRVRQGLTLERFTEAVENCRVKPFLCGENDRGWTATFDWLVENDKNVEKAINNPYGGGNGARIPTGKGIENLGVSQRLIDRIERDRASGENGHVPAGAGGSSDTPALRGSADRTRSEGIPSGDVERFPF